MKQLVSKKLKALAVTILTLILCLGVFAAPVFAADDPYTDGVAITKILAMPIGTTPPADLAFEFEIEPIVWDNAPYDGTNMPSFEDVTLSLPADKADATGWVDPESNPYTIDGITYYVLESGDIFSSAIFDTAGLGWPGAGKYEYKITEKADTNTLTGSAEYTEDMVYSGSEYTLFIYVLESEDTPGTYYVDGIGVIKTTGDDGEEITGEKISVVTPGGDGSEYFFSQIIFNNDYWKTAKGDPENPDKDIASLTVSKTIAGAAIVPADNDRLFSFTLTATPPSIIPADMLPGHYNAFVVGSDGNIVTDLTDNANAADIGTIASGAQAGTQYIKFVPGEATSFKLKHGEKLVFVDTPIGMSYVTAEGATPYFLPGYVVTTAGVAANAVAGNTSQSLTTGKEYTGEGQGMAVNLTAFTNTCDSTPETGLNGVPFYGLSLLAFAGIVAMIIVKSRKKKECYSEK